MANERSSGTAFFSSNDEKSVLAGAHDYFVNNVLPSDIKACVRKIKAPTLYVNNHDETFLLVRSGHGTLTVNGLDYRLKPDTLVNLGPFHRYRYQPDKGETLEIAESRMNSGTYVYLVANPYMKFEQFYVPSEPPVVALHGLYAEIANDAMGGILAETERQSPDQLQQRRLGRLSGQLMFKADKAALGAVLFLPGHIDPGGGVIPHQDHRKARPPVQGLRCLCRLRLDLGRQRLAVNACCHQSLPLPRFGSPAAGGAPAPPVRQGHSLPLPPWKYPPLPSPRRLPPPPDSPATHPASAF